MVSATDVVWDGMFGTGPLAGMVESFDEGAGIVTLIPSHFNYVAEFPVRFDLADLWRLGVTGAREKGRAKKSTIPLADQLVGPSMMRIDFRPDTALLRIEPNGRRFADLILDDSIRWCVDKAGVLRPGAPIPDQVRKLACARSCLQVLDSLYGFAASAARSVAGDGVGTSTRTTSFVAAWPQRVAQGHHSVAALMSSLIGEQWGYDERVVAIPNSGTLLSGAAVFEESGSFSGVTSLADPYRAAVAACLGTEVVTYRGYETEFKRDDVASLRTDMEDLSYVGSFRLDGQTEPFTTGPEAFAQWRSADGALTPADQKMVEFVCTEMRRRRR